MKDKLHVEVLQMTVKLPEKGNAFYSHAVLFWLHSRCNLPYSSVAGDSAQNTAMGHMHSSVAAYKINVKFDTNGKIVIQYKRNH